MEDFKKPPSEGKSHNLYFKHTNWQEFIEYCQERSTKPGALLDRVACWLLDGKIDYDKMARDEDIALLQQKIKEAG